MVQTKQSNLFLLVLTALFAVLIAVGAFIRIPVPIVPFTMQVFFVNLAVLILGSKRGSAAVLIYIAVGLIGLPVFARGGGISYIFQPTFGYLIGFAVGNFTAGTIIEKSHARSRKTMLIASFINISIIYFVGMIFYYCISNYYLDVPFGIKSLLLYCFAITLPGDIVSCFLSVFIVKRLQPVLQKKVF